MSDIIRGLLSDAQLLNWRIKDHSAAADSLVEQASALGRQVEAMKSFREEVAALDDVCQRKPRLALIQSINHENLLIRQLQQENRELSVSLDESHHTLEFIMNKYRVQVGQLMSQRSLAPLAAPQLHQQHELVDCKEKIVEMVAVMRRAADVDSTAATVSSETIARLRTENQGLRELLQLARNYGSVGGDSSRLDTTVIERVGVSTASTTATAATATATTSAPTCSTAVVTIPNATTATSTDADASVISSTAFVTATATSAATNAAMASIPATDPQLDSGAGEPLSVLPDVKSVLPDVKSVLAMSPTTAAPSQSCPKTAVDSSPAAVTELKCRDDSTSRYRQAQHSESPPPSDTQQQQQEEDTCPASATDLRNSLPKTPSANSDDTAATTVSASTVEDDVTGAATNDVLQCHAMDQLTEDMADGDGSVSACESDEQAAATAAADQTQSYSADSDTESDSDATVICDETAAS